MSSGAWTGSTFTQFIVDALTRYPDREAIVYGSRRLTYGQAADMTARLQQVLREAGVRDGATLVALSPNVPEVFLAQVAAWLNNARYCGLHPLASVADHLSLCEDAEASVLLVHPDYAHVAAVVAERSASIETVLTLGPADLGRDVLSLLEAVPSRPLRAPAADAESTVWLPYTGGTTGRPKGVMHSHRSMVQCALAVMASWELPARPRYLACSPITHAAMLPIVPTLARGGTVVLNQGFDPDAWLDTVEREHVDYAFLVPTMLYAMLDEADPARHRLPFLETVLYGSSPMSVARLEEAIAAFGPVFAQGYGQTETLGVGTVLRKDEHDPVGRPHLLASCGRPVAGGTAALLDEDSRPVPSGQVGELCLRGGWTMNGYWRQPDATEEALRGGWLRTGDLAVRDDDGYLFVVDRKKDMIISGAFNVYPRDVEEVIAGQAGVSAVAVIGVPDERWGEAVTAFVVPRPGSTIDTAALQSLVRECKGPHQTPKAVHVVEALPLTSVGKVDKKALRASYWSGTSRAVN